ncbi:MULTISPECIES: hypothetical protein [unclassified Synechocystis]|uniref:hypothetical protein n=1 Tax=unclassified Synechocystis TaxID=2640012 RepID=UPI00042694EA|nr:MULTISPECIES: hypothetical protein [unclassified Synechocystis]AIE73788.1 hypothetical protein D082_12600 [Synechocystis sp. PCC 6714]MCT0252390.1 hypothetical protein [Synechocystis sp. CS-94]
MLKKILIFLVLSAIAGVGVSYYFWQRATRIPAWFEAEKSSLPMSVPEDLLQEKIHQEVAQAGDRQKPIEVTLTEKELGQVLQTKVGNQLSHGQSVPRIQTRIKEERLEVGTVLDPEMLNNSQLSPDQQRIIDRVLPLLPNQNQPFYIGIEGNPQVQQGQLLLAENSRIKIGDLSFSVDDVAQRLNIPREKLNGLLQINVNDLDLEDLQIQDGTMRLQVNAQRELSPPLSD